MSKDWKGNYNSLYKTIGATNHTDKERAENDYYATDPIAIDKLLSVEKQNISNNIWECAAGGGHLSKRLKDFGYNVYSTDIVDRNFELNDKFDFLSPIFNPITSAKDTDIITNPPYSNAKEFVLKALDLVDEGRNVCMFLKLTFLEGKSRYKELFSKYPPRNIYVFSERIMCAKNGNFKAMKDGGGSAVAFAWFVWTKGYKGDTIVKWI